jgi:uncharacterized protein (DUF1501 family)
VTNKKNNLSRRNFIGQASCAAIGSTTLFSTLFNLKAVNASASFNSSLQNLPGDYKALICLVNSGGLDSFNMLVPRSSTAYTEYATTRSNLAIAQSALRPINPLVSDGKDYGLHPSLVRMQTLFDTGKLAFISNAGSLVEPVTKAQYNSGTHPLPLGLYSHADQSMHWQTGVPNARVSQGWGGKMADLMISANSNDKISMSMSISGSNIFQTGETSTEFTLDPIDGSLGIIDYENNDWAYHIMKTQAINNMVNPAYKSAFKNTYTNTIKKSIEGNRLLSSSLNAAPSFNVPFTQPSNNYIPLSKRFEMIAKIIAVKDTLEMKRQIFFVEYGGWDHHDELLTNQSTMLTELDKALYEFNAAMEQLGVADKVTTFSLSEFGRTLTSNGNGTDHAWGGNVFVMGGAVAGQKMYGSYPALSLGNNNLLDVGYGTGVLIPTTAVDSYFAELALWFGVPSSDLVTLFPNIGNFYNVNSNTKPIGFLNY